MVAIAFAAAAPAILGTSTAGLIATAGIGMLLSYADQTQVYPALFGKRNPKPDSLEGLQVSTTDPGAPRWEVYGTRAWVPCHYLWSLNIRDEVSGNGQAGKGGRPFVQTVRIDAGIAVSDGPIAQIETMYADERPFWLRQPNQVVLEDHRWVVVAGTGADVGLLLVQATDADVQDFAGVFEGGDASEFVRLEGFAPSALNGFYRTVFVGAHNGAIRSTMTLRPLQGQTPGPGIAGSLFEPARIRRIDQGAASHEWLVGTDNGEMLLGRPISAATIPVTNALGIEAKRRWVVGAIYRFTGWRAGRWKLTALFTATTQFLPTAHEGVLRWQAVPGDVQNPTQAPPTGTASLPLIITREEGGSFVFIDQPQGSQSPQSWVEYKGTDDQPQDPTLSLSEPNPPAHRGIAHMSFANWNLGPHNNRPPLLTALVRARSGETVAQALLRIWMRTAPFGTIDVSRLRTKALFGYAIPGGLASGPAMQPLLAFYGLALQDRGGVMTVLDERDLPVAPVPARHLNARAAGESNGVTGVVWKRVDSADIQDRVQLLYVSPTGENELEGDGDRAPGSAKRGTKDTLQINLRPLVANGYEVKRRARELKRRARIETKRGQTRLPPGYLDVLPGHCITSVSNNEHEEYAPVGPTIAYSTELRDLLPRSVQVQVRFANGQVATLQDDGAGKLGSLPGGITTSVNTVDYAAGRIELLASVALDTAFPPRIRYLYLNQWLARVNRANVSGFDFTVAVDLVTTTRDDPLPPVPRDLPTGLGGAIATEVPLYRSHVLDLPPMFPTQARSVWIGFAIAPEPGAPWRGAIIYQSPNGTDRWSPIGQVQQPAVVGTLVANNLPTRIPGGFHPGQIDWSTDLEIDLPGGDQLESVTLDQIAQGQNWLLVGDEIIGFHTAVASTGSTWIVRGLVRGLRHTLAGMDTHAAGERVVLLNSQGLIYHEPVGGSSAAGRTYHFRVVPGGASIDQVETITTFVRGRSALPAPPVLENGMVQPRAGGLDVRWQRRGIDQTTVFGPSPLQAGEFERYQVDAFNIGSALVLVAGGMPLDQAIAATLTQRWFVGDGNMGTPYAVRQVFYDGADILAHGYIPGVTPIGFVVRQITAAGAGDRSDVVFVTPI